MKAPRNPWLAQVWQFMLDGEHAMTSEHVGAMFGKPPRANGSRQTSNLLADAANAGWFDVIRREPNVYVAKVPGDTDSEKWRGLRRMPRVRSIFELRPV